MNEQDSKNKTSYVCVECGLHYESKEMMEKCQTWCAENKSCSLDITKMSIEVQESKNGVDS